MELRHLRSATVLAEELNFRKAAEVLNMTQPPLSRQISLLEDELGVRLFKRGKRGVTLSPAGKFFVEGARRILSEATTLRRMTGLVVDKGPLRIACVGSIMFSFFPDLLARLKSLHPDIRFEIRELSTENQEKALSSGEIDLGIAHVWSEFTNLKFSLLGEETITVLYHSALSDEIREHGLDVLSDRDFISGSAMGMQGRIKEACVKRGLIPKVAFECTQFSSIIRFVVAGLGWTGIAVPRNYPLRIDGIESFPLDDRIPFGLIHRNISMPESVQRIIASIKDFVALCRPENT